MQGLPPTDLFTGTWEVFYTDGHVYPLWPCPEGKEAREEIADIIRNS